MNWDKTYIMPIVSSRAMKNLSFDHEYKFGDDVVRLVKVFKLFGVHVDCTLPFVTNVEETCKKVRELGLLRLDNFEHIRDIDTMAFNSLLRNQGLFCFGFRVFYRSTLFTHKVFNQSNAFTLSDCFLKTTHRYSLRHTQRFNVAVSRRVCDDMNFFIFAPKYINYPFIDSIYYNFTILRHFYYVI